MKVHSFALSLINCLFFLCSLLWLQPSHILGARMCHMIHDMRLWSQPLVVAHCVLSHTFTHPYECEVCVCVCAVQTFLIYLSCLFFFPREEKWSENKGGVLCLVRGLEKQSEASPQGMWCHAVATVTVCNHCVFTRGHGDLEFLSHIVIAGQTDTLQHTHDNNFHFFSRPCQCGEVCTSHCNCNCMCFCFLSVLCEYELSLT